jgi:hypothetical protein
LGKRKIQRGDKTDYNHRSSTIAAFFHWLQPQDKLFISNLAMSDNQPETIGPSAALRIYSFLSFIVANQYFPRYKFYFFRRKLCVQVSSRCKYFSDVPVFLRVFLFLP